MNASYLIREWVSFGNSLVLVAYFPITKQSELWLYHNTEFYELMENTARIKSRRSAVARNTKEGWGTIAYLLTAQSVPCSCCGTNVASSYENFYRVQPRLWRHHAEGRETVCLACFEQLLGVPLEADDFTDSAINSINPRVEKLRKLQLA